MPRDSAHMKVLKDAVSKAARALIRDFNEVEKLQVSIKGPRDFVTAADMRSEKILVEELQKARPDYAFLVEESGEIPGNNSEYRWIIDPLDGTTNFLHGLPLFCISAALEKRDSTGKNEILLAVIHCPWQRQTFFAEKGCGAWLEQDGRTERLRVAGRVKLSESLLIKGSFRRADTNEASKTKEISDTVAGIRTLGSTALSLAYVAAGNIDAFFQYDAQPWDIAAGILLIKEAGGFVTDYKGRGDMLENGNILAANDELHDKILRIIK